ncbi:leukocyte immunoglobulin-like receptor subfamily B member 3 isoform X3 [Phacochoerus africanus]|uniref:leukocyte immunoglobulin-like receptor subfamily B member 3 isoform X3 n=1 Tax=Phacochoerus africanus TaxID=41426 RepID=UPI001FD87798|nr:leukocyte immunoglobulin-like receptor subfamily B member 3 isoform X3 [Phacochoerus africanus]
MGGGSTTPGLTALLCLGLCWHPWDQVQAGVLPKPFIWADPAPIVPKGSPVTLWCQGSLQADVYRLYKVGDSRLWKDEAPQDPRNTARFHFESLSSHHAGQYQCAYYSWKGWSRRSDPLALVVTGVYREPSLSAQPGSLVLLGDRLTLQCRSDAGFGRFALTKDEGSTPPLRLNSQHSPDFPLGRVSHTRGGRYRCYTAHNLSDAWSAPSAPLDVLIAGMYQKPSLSAHPRTSVSWGENVTLQCRSEIVLDTFHLFKEGSLAPAQSLRLQDMVAPVQANFTLSPMTSAHNETYRCYTSQSTSPYVLSNPSDPLQLLISGGSKDGLMESGLQRGLPWYLSLLIGVSVAFVLLLLLLLFLLIRQRQQQRGQDTHRKSAAAASVAKDRGQQKSSSPAADIQEEKLYAVMKHTWLKDGNPRDSQAAESDGPQDVTYAQLNHVTLRQGTTAPPPSQAGEPPAEPSVYATLAIRQPTKDPDPRD